MNTVEHVARSGARRETSIRILTLAAPNPSPIARSIAPVTPRSYVHEIWGDMLEIWGDCTTKRGSIVVKLGGEMGRHGEMKKQK